MRLRSSISAAAGVLGVAMAACSWVYGLHDNQGNGCPSGTSHTFCELFDEQPAWPAGAAMPDLDGSPALVENGCDTPPRCLAAIGQTGFAHRKLATPEGAHHVAVEFRARFDQITTGVTPRTMWVTFATANGPVEVGVTFAHFNSGPDSGTDYRVFLFFDDADGGVNADDLMQLTIGRWYDLVLDVDVDSAQLGLRSIAPAASKSHTFADFGVPSFSASGVTSVTVNAGQATGNAQTGVTVDTIYVDVR